MANIRHLNPEGLIKNAAFTQVIVVEGPHKTIYVGGQNAVTADGQIVGEGDIGLQTEQALKNLATALAAAGADLENVVHWSVYAVAGQPVEPALAAFQKVWGHRPKPPTISVVFVTGLANPKFLTEIAAVAVIP